MGAANVSLVFVVGKSLPHATFRLLTRMALIALDSDRPPRYFGGWQFLADGLGYDVPEPVPGDKEIIKRRKSQKREVTKHIDILIKRGIVSRVGKAHIGERMQYALHLDGKPAGLPSGRDDPAGEEGGSDAHPEGGSDAHPLDPRGWVSDSPEGGPETHPKEYEEEKYLGGNQEKRMHAVPQRTRARARTPGRARGADDDDSEYAAARQILKRETGDFGLEEIKQLRADIPNGDQLTERDAGILAAQRIHARKGRRR